MQEWANIADELNVKDGNEYACQDRDLIQVHIFNAHVTIPSAEIHALEKKDECDIFNTFFIE
jgi:hypothetical protein